MLEIKNPSLKSEFPDIAKLWHPTLNGEVKPDNITPFCNKKFWWRCIEAGHGYQRAVDKQVKRTPNCPVCSGKLLQKGVNDVKSKFPKIAEEWNNDKNGSKKPEDFSFISSEKVSWKCNVCGCEWETTIKSRCKNGTGCPDCGAKKRWEKRYGKKKFGITDPVLLEEWDYELNEKGPEYYFPYSGKVVYWHCKKCGYRYSAKICNKANGRKCACCQRKVVVPGKNDLKTTHEWLVKEWDYEKNGDLTPQDVLAGTRKAVYWLCPQGHSYKASINHRSSASRETFCPICNSGRQTSFAEQAVYYYVKKVFPDAISRDTEILKNRMELDIYIPSIKIAIEYDGEAWHKEDKIEREARKYSICREKGIKLIRLVEKSGEHRRNTADEYLSIEDGAMHEPKHLQKVIRFLMDKLDPQSNAWTRRNPLQTHSPIDINLERDRFEIREYMTVIKRPLSKTHPNVASEWVYEKNAPVTPDMVKAGTDEKYYWKCPDCGNEYEASVSHRTAKNPTGCPKCGIRKNALKRAKKVAMLDPITGEVLKVFESVNDASRQTNISRANIGCVCNGTGGRTQAGGFGWKFV